MFSKSQVLRFPELVAFDSPEFVVRRVLEGGMGVCACAQNRSTGELIAVKALRPELASTGNAGERFAEEGRTWMKLSHLPGVVPALGVVKWNEISLIAAEWMEGGDLRRRMASLDPETYFETALRVARTLEIVNTRQGVVHRDIKPSNILLDAGGKAFVADWGLAAIVRERHAEGPQPSAPSGRRTLAGEILGTPLYMAPEQIHDPRTVDWRADLYALGCVLYEWEMGRPPFVGRTFDEICTGHLRVPPPSLKARSGRGRFGSAHIVSRCLAKHPSDRYGSYGELMTELEAAARALGISVARPEAPPAPAEPLRSQDDRFALVDATEAFAEANALMGFGRYEEAKEILAPFHQPELLEPGRGWHLGHTIAVNLALCLSNLERDQARALELFRQLGGTREKPVGFYLNYSSVLMRAGEYEAAERLSRSGLAEFPEDQELWGNLLSALTHQEKLVEAFEVAERRLSRVRDVAALLEAAALNQVASNVRIEDWPTATKHLKEALKLLDEAKGKNPGHVRTHYMRAQVLRELFRFNEALEQLAVVFEEPGAGGFGEWALALQMRLLWDVRDQDAALDFAKKWLPLMKDTTAKRALERVRAFIIADRFMIGMNKGDRKVVVPEVVTFYENQVRSSTLATVDDYIELARIYEWMDRAQESDRLFEICLEKWPGHWRALMNRAHLCHRSGNGMDPIRMASRAVESAPYRPEPLDGLALLYEWRGEAEAASRARARAEEVFQLRKRLAM